MMEYFMDHYAMKLLLVLVLAAAGMAGYLCQKAYRGQIDTEEKQSIAEAAVLFVEQVFKELHGPAKLSQALETARILLAKKGIDFDGQEMRILIEAAVAEFNDAFYRTETEADAKITYDAEADEDPGENAAEETGEEYAEETEYDN